MVVANKEDNIVNNEEKNNLSSMNLIGRWKKKIQNYIEKSWTIKSIHNSFAKNTKWWKRPFFFLLSLILLFGFIIRWAIEISAVTIYLYFWPTTKLFDMGAELLGIFAFIVEIVLLVFVIIH